MNKSIKIIIFLSFFSLSTKAQTIVKGQIMQNDTTRVEFCNALILNSSDSSFISGEMVQDGLINLSLEQSAVILKITAVGYQDLMILINQSIDIGKRFLSPLELGEVEIKARKLPFEFQNGNTKINVSNSIFKSSASLQEILHKSPGVIVSNGEINVIGSGQAIIYLDRKQITYSAMQAIPVSQIESIEIIKNPDASYDAEGKSVILIVLKQLGLEGVQGTVNAHYTKGFYQLGYLDASLNYKKRKWDLSTSINKNWGATGTRRNDYFDVKSNDPYTANSSYREKVYLPHVYNYLIGAKYQISPKHYFSTQFNGNYSKYNLEVENSIDQNINQKIISFQAKDTALSLDQTNVFSANYNIDLDTLGSRFFIGSTYSLVQVSYADIVQEVSNERILKSYSSGKNSNLIGSIQIDYQKNFLNAGHFKLGAKYTNSSSVSSVNLESKEADTMVNYRNDQFSYDEQIISSYINWNKTLKKGDLQIGLRTEQTKSKAIKSQSEKSYIDTSYLSFFPNAGFITKFKNWSMSDQFTSKISRARYSDITPYIYYLNSFVSIYGNPYVKPSFEYNFEHKFTYKKTSFSLGYNHTNRPRAFINLQDDNSESTNTMKVVNMDRLEKVYLEIRKATNFKAIYNYSTVNVSYDTYKSKIYNFGNTQSIPQVYAYTYNRISIKKWFDFEIIGSFTSKYSNGMRSMRSQGELDLGISKSFNDDKCFFQITVNDIFQTAKPSPFAYLNSNYYSSTTTQDTRFLRIFFSYQFGKLKSSNYEHVSLDDDEIQRSK